MQGKSADVCVGFQVVKAITTARHYLRSEPRPLCVEDASLPGVNGT